MVSYEEAIQVRDKIALFVEILGEEAIPAFIRAEKIVQEAQKTMSAEERALQIARSIKKS
ncbi:hypothetical protein [Epibacterium ulvae]|uniref:hypothetical protein n=1 Tax=Epibacterium ulvae TaxID=1156985 RepID=UPI00249037E1|nr:hypothetical protein [Epibacterium ulvae]